MSIQIPAPPGLRAYSISKLYARGIRWVDDYDEEAAVDHYMDLHPDADRDAVEKELRDELDARAERARQAGF